MKTVLPAEHHEQAALIAWADFKAKIWPELGLLHAIPNGGHRHIAIAQKLKAEGVRPGVPDLCLPVPKGGYHGLYIEMKRAKGGQVSSKQKTWLKALNAQGYLAVACPGFEAAKTAIEKYLEIKE